MYQSFFKRLFDLTIAIIAVPILSIIWLPIYLAIKIEDKGSIIYPSTRLGVDMVPFKMYKFRSMAENAPDIRNSDGTTYNATDDARVTKVGRFLRKTSLDELPQIINILKGDMSWIGPRPSPLGDKSIYPEDFFLKFKVRPGITGYSQAKVRNNATMPERIALDKYYVETISLILDIKIIWWTIVSVLSHRNINRN